MKNLFRSAAIIALATIALTLSGCWPAQKYDNYGLSFDYPGGWTVTVDEAGFKQGYLQLEKTGSQPTASIIFAWMESQAQIGADMMIAGIFQQMKIDDGLADVVSEPAQDVTYGDYPARGTTYTATIDGTPVAGAVWVFSAQGKIMNVAIREGADKANMADFKKMRDSFELK